MRRLSLGAILALGSAVLVLLAVAGAGVAGVLALRRLADEQALARVGLAGASAAQEMAAEQARLETAARLLAERPTLRSLVRDGRAREAERFLENFRRTGELDGAALFAHGEVFAASGDLDWSSLRALPAGGYPGAVGGGSVPLLLARGRLADEGAEVLAVTHVDAELLTKVSRAVGLPVAWRSPEESLAENTTATRSRSDGAYLDRRPLAGANGASLGTLETRLDAAEVDASLRRVARTLLVSALVAAGVVLAAGLALGGRLLRPLARVGEAAERLGSGDLRTPVPPARGREAERLSATLEDSRRRLLGLTTELRRREAEARTILESIVEGVYAVDDARRITYMSPQAAKMLGVDPARALERFCGDVLRPLERDGRRPCHDDCPIVHARSRGSARATELIAGEDGGVARRVVITSSPPVDGRQVQVLRDETAEEANRRVRDNVLANLSHELRTPLAAQLASIELLGDGLEELPPESARELVAALERSTLRLTRLIDNLLASVRLESGRWDVRLEPVSVAAVAREAAAMLSPLLRQRRQRLQLELPPSLPPVHADRTQLTHVLLNLLANANRFAPDDSAITLRARVEDDDTVSIAVEDEGPGLPPSGAGELFRRWSRPGEAGGTGVGLGLSIVRAIVERHGGAVAAENRAEGGARVVVTLPVDAAEPGAPASRAAAS